MSITVGLDFGTHQTKICVEDSTDSNNKTHRFIAFRDNDGNDTLFLPSIVQINEDNTVSYGFVDQNRCKTIVDTTAEKPLKKDFINTDLSNFEVVEKPQRPINVAEIKKPITKRVVKPIEPQITRNTTALGFQLLKLEYQKQLKLYNTVSQEWNRYDIENNKRDEIIAANTRSYEALNQQYNKYLNKKREIDALLVQQEKKYETAMSKWQELRRPESLNFRYFKMPLFVNNNARWDHKISYNYIAVWYIAYIILLLNEKYGEANYSIQMGIPTTYDATGKHRNKAYQLLFSAYDLAENKFSSMSEFCSAPYYELVSKTDLEPSFDRDKVIEYGMMAIPEAYASLCAVTRQKSLRNGMHFLVDIGGGTTDIAFFTITPSLQPDIHIIDSMPKGINYILEKISENNGLTLVEAQDEFRVDNTIFKREIEIYKRVLTDQLMSLRHRVTSVFRANVARDDSDLDMLFDAFKDRQITYCGGGGTYESLHVGLGIYFNDLKTLNKNMLPADTIVNMIDDNLYPILSTSYGLSIELDELPRLTPLNWLFNHIQLSTKNSVAERNDDM